MEPTLARVRGVSTSLDSVHYDDQGDVVSKARLAGRFERLDINCVTYSNAFVNDAGWE